MADGQATGAVTPAKKSRWQFGTRTLLIAFTLLCLAVGWGSLHFYRNLRHDQALRAIKEVGGQTAGEADGKVARVYLANPELDDAAIGELLGHLRYVRGLEELDLVNLPITDEAVVYFYGFPKLKQLYLFETDLTEAGVAQIAAALPHVEVKLEAPDPIATRLAGVRIFRHAIVALADDRSSSRLVTGSGDGTLRWWHLPTLDGPTTIKAHDNWLFAAAFHPDGTRLATAGGDNLVCLWDVGSGKKIDQRAGHDDDVHAVGFSRDGAVMYSAGDDRTLRRWEVAEQGGAPKIIARHRAQIPCLVVHPASGEVLTGSRDHTIGWWDATTGEQVRRLVDHTADVMSLAFSADGRWLASASYDGTVRLRSAVDGTTVAVLRGHRRRVYDVAFDPQYGLLASCGDDGVIAWDIDTRKPRFTYTGAAHAATVRFVRDGQWLVAADAEGFLHVIDCRSGKLYRKIATARAHFATAR